MEIATVDFNGDLVGSGLDGNHILNDFITLEEIGDSINCDLEFVVAAHHQRKARDCAVENTEDLHDSESCGQVEGVSPCNVNCESYWGEDCWEECEDEMKTDFEGLQ